MAEVDALVNRPEGPDRDGILGWLDRELPGVMALVPGKGRTEFATGVIEARIRQTGTFFGERRGRQRTRRKNHKPT